MFKHRKARLEAREQALVEREQELAKRSTELEDFQEKENSLWKLYHSLKNQIEIVRVSRAKAQNTRFSVPCPGCGNEKSYFTQSDDRISRGAAPFCMECGYNKPLGTTLTGNAPWMLGISSIPTKQLPQEKFKMQIDRKNWYTP